MGYAGIWEELSKRFGSSPKGKFRASDAMKRGRASDFGLTGVWAPDENVMMPEYYGAERLPKKVKGLKPTRFNANLNRGYTSLSPKISLHPGLYGMMSPIPVEMIAHEGAHAIDLNRAVPGGLWRLQQDLGIERAYGGRLSGGKFRDVLLDTLRRQRGTSANRPLVEGLKDYERSVTDGLYSGDTGERNLEHFAHAAQAMSQPNYGPNGLVRGTVSTMYPELRRLMSGIDFDAAGREHADRQRRYYELRDRTSGTGQELRSAPKRK